MFFLTREGIRNVKAKTISNLKSFLSCSKKERIEVYLCFFKQLISIKSFIIAVL